jgi:tetratricopeptide (TPR) repeat protein
LDRGVDVLAKVSEYVCRPGEDTWIVTCDLKCSTRQIDPPALVFVGVFAEAQAQVKIADILTARGERDEALELLREQVLPVWQQLKDTRQEAQAKVKIADILTARGEPDEALRLLREEVMPVWQKPENNDWVAATWARIADILQARGERDEALELLR